MRKCEGGDDDGSKGKHPFVDRKHRIALYQWIEHRQIERERQLRKHAEEVAPDVSHLGIGGRGTGEDKHQRSTESHEHASRLLGGDRLLENDGRKDHRKDRHRRGDDAGVDGRSDAQSDGVTTLVEHKTEETRETEFQDVTYRRLLTLYEERSNPEEHGSSSDTKGDHVDTRESMCHGILAYGSHQTPKSACQKHAEMSQKRLFVIHLSIYS